MVISHESEQRRTDKENQFQLLRFCFSCLKQEKGLLDWCSKLSFKCLSIADFMLHVYVWKCLHRLGTDVNNSLFI